MPEQKITPEEWAQWKTNQTTSKFFKYIQDFRNQIATEIATSIAMGNIITPDMIAKDAMRCDCLYALEVMNCEDINFFYEPEEEEEKHGDSEQ